MFACIRHHLTFSQNVIISFLVFSSSHILLCLAISVITLHSSRNACHFVFGGVALFLPNINVFEWFRHHLHSSWNAYHFILGGVALFLPNLTVFECFRHQFAFLVECLFRLSCRAVISLSQSNIASLCTIFQGRCPRLGTGRAALRLVVFCMCGLMLLIFMSWMSGDFSVCLPSVSQSTI